MMLGEASRRSRGTMFCLSLSNLFLQPNELGGMKTQQRLNQGAMRNYVDLRGAVQLFSFPAEACR